MTSRSRQVPGENEKRLESELFGHEKGAFTGALSARKGRFEMAEGGTLLLDEIGDMSLPMQVKLLRVLQERSFERVGGNQTIRCNVRVIAATLQTLESLVEAQRFRRDLYYRLAALRIALPSLNERREDVPLLVTHFFRLLGAMDSPLTPDALQRLGQYPWPGNVRELLNRVQRAAIVTDAELIGVADLELVPPQQHVPQKLLHDARQLAERETLLRALRQNDFNITACARHMQVSRVTVYRLCRKHQLALPELR